MESISKKRFFLRFSYDGTAYNGWQIQENTATTVQQELNEKLSMLIGEEIATTGCGRTDTGVHARDFYAHFDITKEMPFEENRLVHKLNAVLPHDIAVHSLFSVNSNANARFDATSRTYEYHITRKKNAFLADAAYLMHSSPDIQKMNEAARILLSISDFSSFSKSNTQTLTNICNVKEAFWKEEGDLLIFTITADRFLRNMVRAIVGTLLKIGEGEMDLNEFKNVIEGKDRSKAGFSVPACGLYLTKVIYPEEVLNGR